MPISKTPQVSPSLSERMLSGKPMWLFKLPSVAQTWWALAMMAQVMSLAEVLPLLPVMPITMGQCHSR